MEGSASPTERGLTKIDLGLKTPIASPEKPRAEERMSDDELGNLISAIGNHEAKAFTLLAMKKGRLYSEKDLHLEVMRKQGKGGWVINPRGVFSYCSQSLSPIGLVVKEAFDPSDPDSPYGYIKTEYGQRVGDLAAAALLKFSYDHPDFSLIDFFAKTSSSSKVISITEEGIEVKKRAPITRLKNFWELATSTLPIRETDLTDGIGEIPEISYSHLVSLAEHGVVTYESVKSAEPVSFFQASANLSKEPPLPFGTYISRTNFVYMALINQPSTQWTADDLADSYIAKLKEQGKEGINRKNLRADISHVLAYLLKEGYATRGKFSRLIQSTIDLTPDQGRAISDLLVIIDGLQNNDPRIIKEAQDFKTFLLSHPEAVATILKKAKEHSPFANQKPTEDTMVDVISLFTQSSGPFTNGQIRAALQEVQGRHLSSARVQSITFELVKQGRLFVASIDKGIIRYTTKPPVQVN